MGRESSITGTGARLEPSPGAERGADSDQISSGNSEGIGRKGTSLASAGPLEGLAGAESVPFLVGSSDRS